MSGPRDDLEFLTTQDMEDEYNETSSVHPAAAASSKSLFESDEGESKGWTAPLKKMALFKESSHPGAAFFHLFFKTAAVLFYWPISGLIGGNFVVVCVICILLLAFDFWTVKNVSGRLLVGLRWWNYVKEDGTTEWVFESTEDTSGLSATDRRIFWVGLYAPAVVWSLLLLVAVVMLKIQWLIVIIAALSLSFANIIGYTKCSKDATQRLQNFADQGMAQNIVNSIGVSNIISGLGAVMGKQQAANHSAAGGPGGQRAAQPSQQTMSV